MGLTPDYPTILKVETPRFVILVVKICNWFDTIENAVETNGFPEVSVNENVKEGHVESD